MLNRHEYHRLYFYEKDSFHEIKMIIKKGFFKRGIILTSSVKLINGTTSYNTKEFLIGDLNSWSQIQLLRDVSKEVIALKTMGYRNG